MVEFMEVCELCMYHSKWNHYTKDNNHYYMDINHNHVQIAS